MQMTQTDLLHSSWVFANIGIFKLNKYIHKNLVYNFICFVQLPLPEKTLDTDTRFELSKMLLNQRNKSNFEKIIKIRKLKYLIGNISYFKNFFQNKKCMKLALTKSEFRSFSL